MVEPDARNAAGVTDAKTPMFDWLTQTAQLVKNGRIPGGALLLAVAVAVTISYGAIKVWQLPIPVAAVGPVVVIAIAGLWRLVSTLKLPPEWQRVLGVILASILVLAFAVVLAMLLFALGRYLLPVTSAGGRQEATPPGALTLREVTSFLEGEKQDVAEAYRRGAHLQVYNLAYESTPTTDDRQSTEVLSVKHYAAAFVQGKTDLLKVQRFVLPRGARYVRGRSNRGAEAADRQFEATRSAVVIEGERTISISRSAVRGKDVWVLPASVTDGGAFCLVAIYPGALLFELGRSDVFGIELDDLAGTTEIIDIFLGGRIIKPELQYVYEIYPGSEVRFAPVARTGSAPASILKNELAECVRRTMNHDAARIWSEAEGSDAEWGSARFEHLHHDLIIIASGKRG